MPLNYRQPSPWMQGCQRATPCVTLRYLQIETGVGPMIVIPIPVNRYLLPLLDAAKSSGFIGLVFVLARTADARDQHGELAEDWTSLHDVTGPLIGVLCPSRTGRPSESVVLEHGGMGVGVQGLRFTFEDASSARERQFERAFWDAASKDRHIRDVIASFNPPPGIITDERPLPPAQLAAAWTAATTESAQHFGIVEGKLPCLLVMSLWEQTSLVVRLRPNLSIYRLLRETVRTLGDEPAHIADLRKRQSALTKQLPEAQRRDEATCRRCKAQLKQLDAAIEASGDLDAELRARCQTALRRTLKSGEPGDAPTALAKLHQQMPHTSDRPPLQHSAVWGLMKLLTARTRVEVLESKRTQAEEDERTRREHLQLSSAVITAYEQVFAAPTIESEPGQGALRGWTVQYVDRTETPALRTTVRRG